MPRKDETAETLPPETDTIARLAKEIKAGHVVERPKCSKCGWTGESPALRSSGCPECGERIG